MEICAKGGLKIPHPDEPRYGYAEAKRTADVTVTLWNQEGVTVKYTDPNGKEHTLNISTSHLVMIVEHKETNACMLIRPSVGAQFLEGEK